MNRIEINLQTGEQKTIQLTDAEIANFPKPTFEQIENSFTSAIQSLMENKAQSSGYDSLLSACSYAGAPNPYQADAQKFVTWRGNVWAYCYGELNKVKTGARAMPTIQQIIMELPTL